MAVIDLVLNRITVCAFSGMIVMVRIHKFHVSEAVFQGQVHALPNRLCLSH